MKHSYYACALNTNSAEEDDDDDDDDEHHGSAAPPQPQVEALQDALGGGAEGGGHRGAQVGDARRPHCCMGHT